MNQNDTIWRDFKWIQKPTKNRLVHNTYCLCPRSTVRKVQQLVKIPNCMYFPTFYYVTVSALYVLF